MKKKLITNKRERERQMEEETRNNNGQNRETAWQRKKNSREKDGRKGD